MSVSDSIQASLDEWSPGETPTVSERASESTPRPNPGTSMTIMVEAEVNQDKDDSSAPPYRDQSRYHPYRGLGSTSQSGSCHRFRRVLSLKRVGDGIYGVVGSGACSGTCVFASEERRAT